ncbi:MAG TPA: hypothetical protein VHW72_10425 [Candidatus Angelobacter sp.]|jgi:hypothetical protein|nr:hypothetical protein [Candidatus Angelobacter sp.]
MADFTGKFQQLTASGSVTQEGACRVQFDSQTFTLAPDSGAPIVCDLGDLDAVIAADYELRLPLYTGSVILLRQFGKAYETLSHDLLEAFRQRTLQCLLLEDLKELARFDGNFELAVNATTPRSGAAEFRLFKSNLAVLPAVAQGFQWRLADVDSVSFDPDTYQVTLRAGQDVLKAGKLAKRTEEFAASAKDAISALAAQSAQSLHSAFPFLTPDQLQATAAFLREGHSASVARLTAINPKFAAGLAANAVDHDLKPYYDDLLTRTAKDTLFAGFKLIRAEDSGEGESGSAGESGTRSETEEAGADASSGSDGSGPETLYWFYFATAGRNGLANLVAWEASSQGGRATYFFRLVDSAHEAELADPARSPATLEAALRRLDRVLGMLNFRRRPIYLSDDELERDAKFHRYAIATRRIPELREVRAAFVGRAVHSSLEAWQGQVKAILAKAGVS